MKRGLIASSEKKRRSNRMHEEKVMHAEALGCKAAVLARPAQMWRARPNFGLKDHIPRIT